MKHRAYQVFKFKFNFFLIFTGKLSQIGLLPSGINKSLNVIYQDYIGDITIWPKPRVMDYLNVLSYIHNPTDLAIFNAMNVAEKNCYCSYFLF